MLYVRVSIFWYFQAEPVYNAHTYFLASGLGFYFEGGGMFGLSHDDFMVKMIGKGDI